MKKKGAFESRRRELAGYRASQAPARDDDRDHRDSPLRGGPVMTEESATNTSFENVIYGDARNGKAPNINMFLIDDQARIYDEGRPSTCLLRHGRAGRRQGPGHPAYGGTAAPG